MGEQKAIEWPLARRPATLSRPLQREEATLCCGSFVFWNKLTLESFATRAADFGSANARPVCRWGPLVFGGPNWPPVERQQASERAGGRRIFSANI